MFRLFMLAMASLLVLGTWAEIKSVASFPSRFQDKPDKDALIKTLEEFFQLVVKEDYETAIKYLAVPAGTDPLVLKGLIEKREISAAGIAKLKSDAKFGTAVEQFGEERAKHFAERASVDVNQCYGFNFEVNGVAAEVIGLWNENSFKLIRVDDSRKTGRKQKRRRIKRQCCCNRLIGS